MVCFIPGLDLSLINSQNTGIISKLNLRISGWVQPNCCLSLSVWWFVYCHHLYSLFMLLCFHFLLIKSRPTACVVINSNKWRKLTPSPSLLLVAPDLLQLPPYFSIMKRCLQKNTCLLCPEIERSSLTNVVSTCSRGPDLWWVTLKVLYLRHFQWPKMKNCLIYFPSYWILLTLQNKHFLLGHSGIMKGIIYL